MKEHCLTVTAVNFRNSVVFWFSNDLISRFTKQFTQRVILFCCIQVLVKEEDRLAVVIDNICQDVAIVPRGAYLRTPLGEVMRNRMFDGRSSFTNFYLVVTADSRVDRYVFGDNIIDSWHMYVRNLGNASSFDTGGIFV